MKRFLFSIGAILGFAQSGVSQSGSEPNAGSRITYSSSNQAYTLRWFGGWGQTYVVQWSDDLATWHSLPGFVIGTGEPASMIFWPPQPTHRFFRLAAGPDIVTDSDHDGVSDYYETNLYYTDPTKADTNGDGVSDTRGVPEPPPYTQMGKCKTKSTKISPHHIARFNYAQVVYFSHH